MISDRPTDRPTDIVTYRVACTRLKSVYTVSYQLGKETDDRTAGVVRCTLVKTKIMRFRFSEDLGVALDATTFNVQTKDLSPLL